MQDSVVKNEQTQKELDAAYKRTINRLTELSYSYTNVIMNPIYKCPGDKLKELQFYEVRVIYCVKFYSFQKALVQIFR